VDVAVLTERVLAADRRSVARAISMVEDGADGLPELSAGLYPHTGNAYTVGLTGSPGVGKSSLAEHLVRVARSQGFTVAVLAIDPTSPFTGGALLGDRLRMQSHATDPSVFIRSMATRGHLGGMALAAPEAIRILDASGKQLVMVETVGVGQAEVEVAHATDTTLVVVSPGWGDAVQVAKAGILEIADVFVVNKADREGAAEAARDIQSMLHMGPNLEWTPPVVRTSTVNGEGIDDLWDAIESHRRHQESSGTLEEKRRRRIVEEVKRMVGYRLQDQAAELVSESGLLEDLAERRIDPYGAAAQVIDRILGGRPGPRRTSGRIRSRSSG
jgi:LAO/AO transport system kinase